jgi:hypothetical protein
MTTQPQKPGIRPTLRVDFAPAAPVMRASVIGMTALGYGLPISRH